jgi:hypothetical protein
VKDYRLTPDEAATRDAWHVVNDVIFRIADDAPSLTDAAALRRFFADVPPLPAAAFAAWFTAGFAANGGFWHIFDCCAAPLIVCAIEGYELLGEPYAADCLRRACSLFPASTVPDSTDEASDYLSNLPEDSLSDIDFERDRHIKDFFDLPALLRDHPDEFIRNTNGA